MKHQPLTFSTSSLLPHSGGGGKNIANHIVRASNPINPDTDPGTFSRNRSRCATPVVMYPVQTRIIFASIDTFGITSHFTCTSCNVVFANKCTNRSKLYIRDTCCPSRRSHQWNLPAILSLVSLIHHLHATFLISLKCFDSNFNYAVVDKISIFHAIASNFTNSLKSHFESIIGTFQTNCFYPIHFMAGTCKELAFSFLPVVSC